jgi:hypothetical protein
MKRFVRSWLIFTFAAGALVASEPSALAGSTVKSPGLTQLNLTKYWVTLTGTPANQVPVGSAVMLTAKVMQLPPDTVASAATTLVDPRLRYTFKAQRTYPVGDAIVTIGHPNSPQSVVSWSAQKAGEYTVTVHVTTVQNPLIPMKQKLPEVIGDGTLTRTIIPTTLVSYLTLDPNRLVGGVIAGPSVRVFVQLSGDVPAGATIQVSSSNPSLASAGGVVAVNTSNSTASTYITTRAVTTTTTVDISATYAGSTKHATLTLDPPH